MNTMKRGEIYTVIFSRLCDEQLLQLSDIEVVNQAKNNNVDGTIYDTNLGVSEKGKLCTKCSGDPDQCIGGIGHMKLPMPFYFSHFSKQICTELNGLCTKCHCKSKNINCLMCKVPVLKIIRRNSIYSYTIEYIDKTTSKAITIQELNNIISDNFNIERHNDRCTQCNKLCVTQLCDAMHCNGRVLHISTRQVLDDKWDFEFFDLNTNTIKSSKEIFILLNDYIKSGKSIYKRNVLMQHYLPITPVCTRPYFPRQEFQNDTSTLYNSALKDKTQKAVYSKIEMTCTQSTSKTQNKSLLSIQDRIEGRGGLVVNSIIGKRVNNCGRAIISGYPNGKLGYISLSQRLCNKAIVMIPLISIGDPTTEIGRKKILEFVISNQTEKIHKRAYHISFGFPKHEINGKINMEKAEKIIARLNSLDDVFLERHVKNGDICIFNRQPSIRTESMMAVTIIINNNIDNKNIDNNIPNIKEDQTIKYFDDTIQIPLPMTPPANADFDGDESNAHILQNLRSSIECLLLMSPIEYIISSQKGTPLVVPVQDAIVGLYILSKTSQLAMTKIIDLIMETNIDLDTYEKKKKTYLAINKSGSIQSGLFCISLLFDDLFNMTLLEDDFKITNGIIHNNDNFKGLTRNLLCSRGKLIHQYYFKVGKIKTVELINDIQLMTNKFLAFNGLTIGLLDCKLDIKYPLPAVIDTNTILGLLEDQCRNDQSTNLENIINSGARASMINAVQIKQLIGQQSIDGRNLNLEMRSGRTLAYFKGNQTFYGKTKIKSNDISTTGFIRSAFIDGQTKSEILFGCKAGRRGVSDSVVKVADSGYLGKKVNKKTENHRIELDGSVRDMETNDIISFSFGGDGINPAKLPPNKFEDFASFKNIKSIMRYVNLFTTIKNPVITTLLNNIIKTYCKEADEMDYNLPHPDDIRYIEIEMFKRTFHPYTPIGLLTGLNFGETTIQLLLKSFHTSGIKGSCVMGAPRMNQLMNRTCKSKNNIVSAPVNNNMYRLLANIIKYTTNDYDIEKLRLMQENICHKLIRGYVNVIFSTIIHNDYISNCNDRHNYYKPCLCNKTELFIVYEFTEYSLNGIDIIDILNNTLFFKNIHYIIVDKYTLIIKNNNTNIIAYNRLIRSTIITPYKICSPMINSYDIVYQLNDDLHYYVFSNIPLKTIIQFPFIDKTRVHTNDIFESKLIFGIEAARKNLYMEMISVLKHDAADVDLRYIYMISDSLTYTGDVMSVTKLTSVCTNVFFERVIKKIFEYSTIPNKNCKLVDIGTADAGKSVQFSALTGNYVRFGTHGFDIMDLDNNMLE